MSVLQKLEGQREKLASQRKQEGFTLIELMIVVAIIAILAAIAIPLYLNYTARAQGTEALSLAQAFKPAVGVWFSTHGNFTDITGTGAGPNGQLGMSNPDAYAGKIVKSVAVDTTAPGASSRILPIVATYCTNGSNGCKINNKLSGKTLTLAAWLQTKGSAAISWVCATTADYSAVPSKCRHDNISDAITAAGT